MWFQIPEVETQDWTQNWRENTCQGATEGHGQELVDSTTVVAGGCAPVAVHRAGGAMCFASSTYDRSFGRVKGCGVDDVASEGIVRPAQERAIAAPHLDNETLPPHLDPISQMLYF